MQAWGNTPATVGQSTFVCVSNRHGQIGQTKPFSLLPLLTIITLSPHHHHLKRNVNDTGYALQHQSANELRQPKVDRPFLRFNSGFPVQLAVGSMAPTDLVHGDQPHRSLVCVPRPAPPPPSSADTPCVQPLHHCCFRGCPFPTLPDVPPSTSATRTLRHVLQINWASIPYSNHGSSILFQSSSMMGSSSLANQLNVKQRLPHALRQLPPPHSTPLRHQTDLHTPPTCQLLP